MRIRIPSKKIREGFLLTYELEGCQRAVDILTKYYGVSRMKIVLNGRRVGNGDRLLRREQSLLLQERVEQSERYCTNCIIISLMRTAWTCLRQRRKELLTVMQEIF